MRAASVTLASENNKGKQEETYICHRLLAWEDNYIFLIERASDHVSIVIDPTCADTVRQYAEKNKLTITSILNTHHHPDHVGGNLTLKSHYPLQIFAHSKDAGRIPGVDVEINPGSTWDFLGLKTEIWDVSGHTLGHIAFYFPGLSWLFSGDTLFSMGCGRLFEGTPQIMWKALQKIRSLPNETLVFCSHEYTESNGNFALRVEPKNESLIQRMEKVRQKRRKGEATVPFNLGEEKTSNPFLRADDGTLQKGLGIDLDGIRAEDVFGYLRKWKDLGKRP